VETPRATALNSGIDAEMVLLPSVSVALNYPESRVVQLEFTGEGSTKYSTVPVSVYTG
jgi:hypothetical protein